MVVERDWSFLEGFCVWQHPERIDVNQVEALAARHPLEGGGETSAPQPVHVVGLGAEQGLSQEDRPVNGRECICTRRCDALIAI